MKPYRKTAITVGFLFLVATLFGGFSLIFSSSLSSSDYLVEIYANRNQVNIGVLLVLIMGIAIAAIPVVLFPLLKIYDEMSAIAYIVLRSLETVTYLVLIISRVLLISLSEEFVMSEAPNLSSFEIVGSTLKNLESQISPYLTILFSLSVLVFYRVLYLSKLLPRLLSVWGFIGGTLTFIAAILGIFGLLSGNIILIAILWLPIAVNEIVVALWLIFKGFNVSEIK